MVLSFVLVGSGVADAHQPVLLLDSDTTPWQGPLLVDGTVSFAIRASFTKSGEKKAFRAQFKAGDTLKVEYLIADKKPENTLRTRSLPTLLMTSPTGSPLTLKFTERTKFYEPFSRTKYLYLARYSAIAQTGVYSFTITSKGKAGITISVGDREVAGEVLRGAAPTPTPTPTNVGYTMSQVRANNSATNCWAAIDGYVYNLTTWINSHPGGSGAILALCGTDASAAFNSQHSHQSRPTAQLAAFRLGPLTQ